VDVRSPLHTQQAPDSSGLWPTEALACAEGSAPPLTGAELLAIYQVMTLIRAFELECLALLRRGLIRGVVHPYIGHEAIAASVCRHVRETDKVVSYYRCHGHALALGVDAGELMAEMFARIGGVCRGHGGSMHIVDMRKGFLGGNSIVGAGVPIAAGAAVACQLAGADDATIAFFGDGATGAGCVLETFNIAAAQHLPLVLICENNLYQDQTRSEAVFPDSHLTRLPRAFGIPSETVDGNDPAAVVAATRRALAHVRQGHGPYFVEARTYLGKFHSQYGRSEPAEYRPLAEVATWLERDPLRLVARELESSGVTTTELGAIVRAALEKVEAAVHFASRSADPSSHDLLAGASEVT